MDIHAPAEFLVEVLHAEVVFRVSLHVDIAPYELCLVGDERVTFLPGLHQHLVREHLGAAGYHLLAEFGGDRNLVCQDVDAPRIEQFHHGLQAWRHGQVDGYPFVLSKLADERIVISHLLIAVHEV